MKTLELDQALNDLIIAGKTVEAFEKFYAEDVVARENSESERVGREPWMRGRLDFERKLKKFSARVIAHAADGDTSFSEWEFDLEIEGMGAMNIAQVAVRRWRNGRVVRERFYHK
jgi:SnoaL-like domain